MSDRIKKYQCIKQVHAEPMTFGAFKTSIRNVRDMGQVDPLEPGYLVIYNKGTDDEYKSWSPKKVFEEGYLEIPENAKAPSRTNLGMGKLS